MKNNIDKEKPPCTRTRENEPNFELMAKAFINLYEKTKKSKISDKKENQ